MTYYAGVSENNVSLMGWHVVTLARLAYNSACAMSLNVSNLAYSINVRGMRSDLSVLGSCVVIPSQRPWHTSLPCPPNGKRDVVKI